MSIFLGDPDISVGYYIWKSMIPALLGNIVGGGLMVATMYWYLNLTGEPPVIVDGVGYDDTERLVGREAETDNHTGSESSHGGEKKSGLEDMV